jgi:hypothetical protein
LKKKTSLPACNLPTQNLKGKNPRHLESMIVFPIDWMKFLSSKRFLTIFHLGYYPSQ